MKTPLAVIGLVGEKCAGKDTVQKLLVEELLKSQGVLQYCFWERRTFAHLRFSDILVETLKNWRIPVTRENLQKLPVAMRPAYGNDVLANVVKARVLESKANFVILGGIRWKDSDLPVLRSFPNNFLIYVTASVEIRFEREKIRKQQADKRTAYEGEGESFGQFLREEKAVNEIEIPEIGKMADFKIDNSGTFDDLRLQIRQFITEKLRIRL